MASHVHSKIRSKFFTNFTIDSIRLDSTADYYLYLYLYLWPVCTRTLCGPLENKALRALFATASTRVRRDVNIRSKIMHSNKCAHCAVYYRPPSRLRLSWFMKSKLLKRSEVELFVCRCRSMNECNEVTDKTLARIIAQKRLDAFWLYPISKYWIKNNRIELSRQTIIIVNSFTDNS